MFNNIDGDLGGDSARTETSLMEQGSKLVSPGFGIKQRGLRFKSRLGREVAAFRVLKVWSTSA